MAQRKARPRPGILRHFRGLAFVFVLSLLSFASILLVLPFVGGLPGWTGWQFAGLFGLVEASAGLSSIVLPNIWRMPVQQANSSKPVQFAPSLLIPHWGASARVAAGAMLLAAAGAHEGVGPGVVTLALAIPAFAGALTAVSLAVARAGVRWPEYDVVQLVIRRPGSEHELEPFSVGASVVQFLVGIATIPLAHLVPSSVLFRPELSPAGGVVAAAIASALASCAIAWVAWRGRMAARAPRRQQREMERMA